MTPELKISGLKGKEKGRVNINQTLIIIVHVSAEQHTRIQIDKSRK